MLLEHKEVFRDRCYFVLDLKIAKKSTMIDLHKEHMDVNFIIFPTTLVSFEKVNNSRKLGKEIRLYCQDTGCLTVLLYSA